MSVWLVTAFSLVCCGPGEATPDLRIEVHDGVSHVYSPVLPLWEIEARPFELVEVLGADPSVGGVTFAQPLTVATGADGTRYVLDRHGPTVFMFDGSGNLLGTFGREGEGPGEFASPTDLLLHPDGTLSVLDPGLFRISRFSSGGDFLDMITVETFLSQLEEAGPGTFFAYARFRGTTLRTMMSEMDPEVPQVSVIDSEGTVLRAFARRHERTGEATDIHVNKLFLAPFPGGSLAVSYRGLDRTEIWSPSGVLEKVFHRPPPFGPSPPEYREEDRGPGVQPFTGMAYDIRSSGLAVHPSGEYWAVLVPQTPARFRTPMFGESEIPDEWSIELFDSEGRWLARQPLDFPATNAVLDWYADGLYVLNPYEDAVVYRFGVSVEEGRRGIR